MHDLGHVLRRIWPVVVYTAAVVGLTIVIYSLAHTATDARTAARNARENSGDNLDLTIRNRATLQQLERSVQKNRAVACYEIALHHPEAELPLVCLESNVLQWYDLP